MIYKIHTFIAVMLTCTIGHMTENTYKAPPKRRYVVAQGDTQLIHNKKTKAALDMLATNPEIANWARSNALSKISEKLNAQIKEEAWHLSDVLLSEYGVELCPSVASIWISDQLEKRISNTTQWLAGFALFDGDSKANIARAVGIRQQNCTVRFPQLEEVAKAQEKADKTGEDQIISFRNGDIVDELILSPSGNPIRTNDDVDEN